MRVKYLRRPYRRPCSKAWCSALKIEKIPDTCVSSININRREVCLDGHEAAFRYRDNSLTPLLQKAMTRKATFITKDRVIDWIELKENVPTHTFVEVLRESEENYRNLLELSSNAIVTLDLRGVVTSINEAGEKMMGYSKDEIVGKHVWKIGHLSVKGIPKYKKKLASVIAGKIPKPFEATWYRRDGTPYVVETCAGFLKKNDERTGLQIVIRDITEHKRVKKALGESEKKFRKVFESASDCMIILDKSGRIVDVNRKAVEVFGGSKKEVLGKHFTKLGVVSPREIPRFISRFAKILARTRRKQVVLDIRIKNKKGQEIPLECSSSLIKKDGKITGLLIVARNITERKRTEEEMKESEEKFRNLAEQSPNMIFINKKGRVVYANNKCEEIMGYKKEEFYSPDFDFLTLIAPECLDLLKSSYGRHMKGEEVPPFEYRLVTREGKKIDAILTTKLIAYEGETAILGTVTDITERKRVEELLRENMEKYHSLVTNVPVDVWTIDSKDNPIFINPNVEKLFGFTPEEIRQRGNFFWHERTHPDDRERVKEAYNLFFTRRKTGDIEYRIQRKDGAWVWVHDRVMKVYEKNGVLYADGVTWEITEGKRTEKLLKETMGKNQRP